MNAFSFLKVAALSDVGKKRKNNEDAFGTFPGAGIFCVADGMGGGDDGEIASAAVVRAVEETAKIYGSDDAGGYAARDVAAGLAHALSQASAWICNRAHARKLNGCGSTFVGAVFDATQPSQALAVHAGDSRLYLLHGRSIRQITRDHSVAELMGEKDESKVNPMFRSMVVNGIGIRSKADPEFTPFEVASGDRVLICSDGLSRMVPDKQILAISRGEKDPSETVKSLIAAALEAGGIDNVTVVLVEVGELPSPRPRLTAPVEPIAPEDAETADDPTTDGDETTGQTGETQTVATIAAGFTEEAAFGENEEGRMENDSSRESNKVETRTRGQSRWLLWLLVTAGALAVLIGVLLYLRTVPLDKSLPEPPLVKSTENLSIVKTNAVPIAVDKTVETAPKSFVPPAAVIPRSAAATAAVDKVSLPVTNAAAVVPPPPDPGLMAFASVCEEKSAKAFVQAVRRLWPKQSQPLDFDEEAERFLKSARQLARMRGKRDAEAAAVDLRVLLLNAEQVREILASRRSESEYKTALGSWTAVLKGDPATPETQAACVRLMKELPGVRAK